MAEDGSGDHGEQPVVSEGADGASASVPPAGAPPRSASPLEYARIHASILAMVFAALWAYSLIGHRHLDELRAAVMEAQDQINTLGPPSWTGRVPQQHSQGDTTGERAAQVRYLVSLAMGVSPDLPASLAEQGEQYAGLLCRLANQYPLPTNRRDDGHGRVSVTPDRVHPVRLTAVAEVRDWVGELEPMLQRIAWLWNVNDDRRETILNAYFAQFGSSGVLATGAAVAECRAILGAANRIVVHTRAALGRYDLYQQALPSWRTRAVVTGTSVLTFACAVLLPLIWARVWPVLYIYVPAGYYVLALGALSWMVLR